MARPSQPENAPQDPDPRYLTKDPRRESWVLPNEDTEPPFNPKTAELGTQEDFDNWVGAHGSKDLFQFFHYALKYHDDQIEAHNELVQMVDNAAHSVAQLEETVQERDATIARQSAALLSDLSYRGQLGEGTEGPRGRGQGGSSLEGGG